MDNKKEGDLKILNLIELIIGKSLQKCEPENIMGTVNGYVIDPNGNITGLNLHALHISDITIIKKLKNLTHLDLSANRLEDISVLSELKYLVYLDLNSNQLTDISPLKSLNSLNFLNLSANRLEELSPLRGLRVLSFLDLNTNCIWDVAALKSLTALKELYLHANKLTNISAIGYLTGLKTLTLQRNRISDLEPLAPLMAQTVIEANDNKIYDVSFLENVEAIKRLDLRYNRITFLPPGTLDTEVPIKWRYEKDEEGLYLSGNPLESPPVEIIKQGTDAVANYFEETKNRETCRFLESKLLIVGSGDVGKTTLLRKLQDINYQVKVGEEPFTHGLNIQPWQLDCTFDDGETETVKLHLWDFGGQDIYHATHHFFLTKRSLYLLVWEPHKEKEPYSITYWLNLIKLLSDNSPVIVAMNKADVYSQNLDEAAYKEKFSNIVTFGKESCLTGEGIPQIKEQIKQTLSAMPHLKDKVPKVWLEIRDQLKEKPANYIDIEEYYRICAQYGLSEEKAAYLSDYLHDLGAILHYKNDRLLANIVILNPEWAVQALYALIDNPDIRQNQGGLFRLNNLNSIWDKEHYPEEKHDELIRLMEKFELCFKVQGSHIYIIPELLPTQRAAINFESYRSPRNLHFLYDYDFITEGIISRFMARNYYLIREHNFWKYGVELEFENSSALVTCDMLNRKIRISVSGLFQKELLAIIRSELEAIHLTLNLHQGIHYRQLVPCNCPSCLHSETPHTYPVEVLENFANKRYPLFCPEGYAPVLIDKLLKSYKLDIPKDSLVKIIFVTASHLLTLVHKLKKEETEMDAIIALILSIKGFLVKTRQVSSIPISGKAAVRPLRMEIKRETQQGPSTAIWQSLYISSPDNAFILKNLETIFFNANPMIKTSFFTVYTEMENFNENWNNYLRHLPTAGYPYPIEGNVKEGTQSGYDDVKIAMTHHRKADSLHTVYHMWINLKK